MPFAEQTADALLDALLSAAVDGIIVIDGRARVRLFNPGAEKLFGYRADEVIGHNVNMLMPEPFRSQHDAYVERYQTTGERRIIGIGREVRALNKAGEEFPIDLSVGEAPMAGQPMYVGILRDLRVRVDLETQLRTERQHVRELERGLAHAHRTSTLGEMAAGIAHEINQPLAAISTYADAGQRFLARDPLQVGKLGHALDSIGTQARRAGDVVRRMRGLARQQETPRGAHQINALIEGLLELARLEARESDAPIELDLADDLPPVQVDSVQIQQVLLNLIRNGLEAMATRSQAALGLLISTVLNADGAVEVSVTDHGVGVPADRVEEIFHAFETSKPDGMGLGLSICRTIVRRHGGRLWYEPNPAGGSRFVFTLPVEIEQ